MLFPTNAEIECQLLCHNLQMPQNRHPWCIPTQKKLGIGGIELAEKKRQANSESDLYVEIRLDFGLRCSDDHLKTCCLTSLHVSKT